MKAAFFESVGSVRLLEVEEPVIQREDEVKVRIVNTGICASDVIGLLGGHPTRKPPVISGHESAGVVAEVGKSVTDFQVGDRVVIEPQYSCGHCVACQMGRYNACTSKKVLGTVNWSGSFAEYITAPQQTLIHLPEEISFVVGALLEPLAVGIHAARLSRMAMGKTAVVIGCGPIGISCLQGCRLAGAEKVIVVDIQEYNLQIAKEMGADHCIKGSGQTVIDQVMQLTHGFGADVVFVAVGFPAAIDNAIEMAAIGGQIMTLAHFGTMPPSFNITRFRWKELSMQGTVMYTRKDYKICMDALHKKIICPEPMVTKVFPVEDCQEAFSLAQTRKEPYVKLMFSF
ncbi:MAG: zinc-dependent alcohol dehydrogenase [Eubacteriales bacterium]|jgi:threonine dehydrogenase-like Zn-dependent dehydrogenase